jgi:hypothetical protein
VSRPLRIIVTAKIAGTTAGHVDHALAYATGFQRLGHEVYLMDYVGRGRCTDGDGRAMPFDAWPGRLHFERTARRYGLWPRCSLIASDRQTHGMSFADVRRVARATHLLIVRSGRFHKLPEVFDLPERRLFFDGNPGQTQMRYASHDPDGDPLERYDALFTLGFNIGTPASPVPCSGLAWHPMPRPVDLAMWHPTPCHNDRFTTISTWNGRSTFTLDGMASGQKADNWADYLGLPALTGERFEVAMHFGASDDRARFTSCGWLVSDPARLPGFDEYAGFIGASRGEFSVAHNRYVAFRTGWFSDRSAVYLARGKPVVVQSTGVEDHLPTGRGLLTFRDIGEAAECLAAIRADYGLHARAARALAVEHFAADRVLGKILATVNR